MLLIIVYHMYYIVHSFFKANTFHNLLLWEARYGEIHTAFICRGNGTLYTSFSTLQWRHNEVGSVSNHQPHECLLNRLFRRRSKKTSKLRVTCLCAVNWWRHHDVCGFLFVQRMMGIIIIKISWNDDYGAIIQWLYWKRAMYLFKLKHAKKISCYHSISMETAFILKYRPLHVKSQLYWVNTPQKYM